jgi:hypothetical protein
MPEHVIYTRMRSDQIRSIASLFPALLAGRVEDRFGIARGFRLRLAVAFLSKVKQAFIVKSRGGTDEAGMSWQPLTREYLAYGRRFGKGEQAALKKAAGLDRKNNKRGLLTAAQNKRWKAIFAQSFTRLAAQLPIGEAKAKAGAIAWAKLKSEGAKTKLDVFGSRQVEILRDTDVMFNSLSPGVLSEAGPDATYSPPEHQVIKIDQSDMLVGTNDEKADWHHNAKNPRKRRRLWPEPDQIPQSWRDDFSAAASRGMFAAVVALSGGRAA